MGGGATSSLLSKCRGFLGFLGAFWGGVLAPLLVLVLLLLLVLLPPPPPSPPILTQPLRCGCRPPSLLPASHLPNPYSTKGAMLGSPQHLAQLGDPHELRPAITPLHPHLAAVGPAQLRADDLLEEK